MSPVLPTPDLDALLGTVVRHGCRVVVVGSAARRLVGEEVVPADLDLVIDATPEQRDRWRSALVALGATIEHRSGVRPVDRCVALPWDWGFTVSTPFGRVDLITRFVDDTTIRDHEAVAVSVPLSGMPMPGAGVRVHPTRHEEAA